MLENSENGGLVEGLNELIFEGIALSLLEHSDDFKEEVEDVLFDVVFVLGVELAYFFEDFLLKQTLKDVDLGLSVPNTEHLVEGCVLR